MKVKKNIAFATAIIIVLAVIPLFVDVNDSYFIFFLFTTFIYVVNAQAWNITGGYTGQISLGQHAFFGLGAYTTAMIWIHNITKMSDYYFEPVTMILSGIVPVILAILVGIPLLSRLRGDYFSLGTLGVGEIIKVFFVKGETITGAADGIHLPSTSFKSMIPYYYLGLTMACVVTILVYLLIRSRIGLAMKAIREDETAAASRGVNPLKYKIMAFALGAFITGFCGSLYAYYLFHVNPDAVFKIDWALYPILMCVIGGTGTIIGPVIGSLFMAAVFTFANVYFAEINPIIAGLLIIVVMRFMPSGLIGLAEKVMGKQESISAR